MIIVISLLTVVLLLFRPNARCAGEYFSATVDMAKALKMGNQLASDLKAYLAIEEKRLAQIRQLADRLAIDSLDLRSSKGPEDIAGNPINAYLAVRRLALNWQTELVHLLDTSKLQKANIQNDQGDQLPSELETVNTIRARVEEQANMLPGDSDVDGAADALLRLQQTYKLQVERLANGHLIDDFPSPKLTAAQCFHIGRQAYDKAEYLIAEGWFREAYNKLVQLLDRHSHGDDGHVIEKRSVLTGDNMGSEDFQVPHEKQPYVTQVLDHLAYALGRQGRYSEALNVTRMILEQAPNESRIQDNEVFYVGRIEDGEGRVGPAPPPEALSKYEEETEMYEATCRAEQIVTPPPAAKMYCRYHVPHPHYLIGPIKEEILYPDPRIVLWHDLIYQEEIERIMELATPRLRRATVKNPVSGKLETAFYRTSKSAWLPGGLDEVTNRMKERIHRVTGLSMKTAEDLQVGNYGIGGHYAPHFDFGRKREKDAFEIENGNRIATIIFYLTDVLAGGATAFNRIGARVLPVRGAAAFWYNLFPSGEGDLRTRHAACPVLVGSKWVMNVWFHERGQEFIRPCNLQQGTIENDDGF